MEFYFQDNSVNNSLKCPKAKSATHCLTELQGVPVLYNFWDLEKIVLCEIHTSWVVHRLNSTSTNLLITNSTSANFIPTALKFRTSRIRTNGDRTIGGPPVFPICQNKHWTIRRPDNHTGISSSHCIILKIVRFIRRIGPPGLLLHAAFPILGTNLW